MAAQLRDEGKICRWMSRQENITASYKGHREGNSFQVRAFYQTEESKLTSHTNTPQPTHLIAHIGCGALTVTEAQPHNGLCHS